MKTSADEDDERKRILEHIYFKIIGWQKTQKSSIIDRSQDQTPII